MPANHLADCPTHVLEGASCTCEVNGIAARCILCLNEFSLAQVTGATECPNCKTKIEPVHPLDDVEVKVNWYELRVLIQFAERVAAEKKMFLEDLPKAIYAIAGRIENQCPSMPPLSLAGEMLALKEKHPEMSIPSDLPELPPRIKLQ